MCFFVFFKNQVDVFQFPVIIHVGGDETHITPAFCGIIVDDFPMLLRSRTEQFSNVDRYIFILFHSKSPFGLLFYDFLMAGGSVFPA